MKGRRTQNFKVRDGRLTPHSSYFLCVVTNMSSLQHGCIPPGLPATCPHDMEKTTTPVGKWSPMPAGPVPSTPCAYSPFRGTLWFKHTWRPGHRRYAWNSPFSSSAPAHCGKVFNILFCADPHHSVWGLTLVFHETEMERHLLQIMLKSKCLSTFGR